MGETSRFYVNLEGIFERSCGEKSFLDEALVDHDAIPPFGDCMVSSSDPITFYDGIFYTMEKNNKINGGTTHGTLLNMKRIL
jgi:hypothetical protein